MHSSQLCLTAKHDIAVIVTTGTKQRWKTYDMYSSESDVVILALHVEVTTEASQQGGETHRASPPSSTTTPRRRHQPPSGGEAAAFPH